MSETREQAIEACARAGCAERLQRFVRPDEWVGLLREGWINEASAIIEGGRVTVIERERAAVLAEAALHHILRADRAPEGETIKADADRWFANDGTGIEEPIHVALGISIEEWRRYLDSGAKEIPAAYRAVTRMAGTIADLDFKLAHATHANEILTSCEDSGDPACGECVWCLRARLEAASRDHADELAVVRSDFVKMTARKDEAEQRAEKAERDRDADRRAMWDALGGILASPANAVERILALRQDRDEYKRERDDYADRLKASGDKLAADEMIRDELQRNREGTEREIASIRARLRVTETERDAALADLANMTKWRDAETERALTRERELTDEARAAIAQSEASAQEASRAMREAIEQRDAAKQSALDHWYARYRDGDRAFKSGSPMPPSFIDGGPVSPEHVGWTDAEDYATICAERDAARGKALQEAIQAALEANEEATDGQRIVSALRALRALASGGRS